jgi:hypothetical protein
MSIDGAPNGYQMNEGYGYREGKSDTPSQKEQKSVSREVEDYLNS